MRIESFTQSSTCRWLQRHEAIKRHTLHIKRQIAFKFQDIQHASRPVGMMRSQHRTIMATRSGPRHPTARTPFMEKLANCCFFTYSPCHQSSTLVRSRITWRCSRMCTPLLPVGGVKMPLWLVQQGPGVAAHTCRCCRRAAETELHTAQPRSLGRPLSHRATSPLRQGRQIRSRLTL